MPAIQADTNRLLSGSYAAFHVASTREEKFAGPSWGSPDVTVDRFLGLLAQFEPDWMSGFPLADRGAIDGHAVRGHTFDLQADHIAAAQLAVDG